jgi:hypothetical protein
MRRNTPGFGPAEPFDEDSGRGPILLGICMAVLLALIGIIWSTYNQGVREGGRDAPPHIVASVDPYKVQPEDPGGVETAHLDIRVFDVIEEPADEAPAAAEAPSTAAVEDGPPVATQAVPPSFEADLSETEVARLLGVEDQTLSTAAEAVREAEAAPPARSEGPRTLETAAQTVEETSNVRLDARPLADSEIQTASAPTGGQTPARAAAPSPAASQPATHPGTYFVQVASYRSEDAAGVGWNEFRAEFGSMLRGKRQDVARADLGDRGVHYRLRVAGFDSREAASDFCDQLKARERECLVTGS